MKKYRFSKSSAERLTTCHTDLILLFNHVIEHVDCAILCGSRSKEEQNNAFEEQRSKLKYPNSKHNSSPSVAIDAAPYPIDWGNLKMFYYFGGYVKGIADDLFDMGVISHCIRWGGDWDGDNDFSDQKFNDLVHFELKI